MTKTEISLVIRAQRGDEEAFNELYKTYYKQAYYIAMKISNCDADAKDAAQETFIQIKKSICDLHEPKNFRKWMAQIVLSKCNKIFRKNRYAIVDPSVLNSLPQEEKRSYMSGHQEMEMKSRKAILFELMKMLTFQQREILVLTYFEQMSMKEMAEVLSIPEGTVKSRLKNAKEVLKKHAKTFEEANGIRLHTNFLPLILLFAARKEYVLCTGVKPNVSFSSLLSSQPILMSAGIATLATTSVIAVSAGSSYYLEKNKMHEAPKVVQNVLDQNAYFEYESKQYSQRDIYLLLREWAHCKVELEDKTADEFAQIHPFYNFLKEKRSPYYDKLMSYGWIDAFENYKK